MTTTSPAPRATVSAIAVTLAPSSPAGIDPYFDNEAALLVARLIVAASTTGVDRPQLIDELLIECESAAEILDTHGLTDDAAAVRAVLSAPRRQSDGVLGAARAIVRRTSETTWAQVFSTAHDDRTTHQEK